MQSENSKGELASRTQALEQNYEELQRELAWVKNRERDRVAAQESPPPSGPSGVPVPFMPASTPIANNDEPSPESVFERNTNFMAGTSLFQQIDLLDRSMVRDLGNRDELMFMFPEGPGGQIMDYESLSVNGRQYLDRIVEQTRMDDVGKILQALDIYFAYFHGHYPCINEVHFRSQFAAFLANDQNCMSKPMAIQFAALLNFVVAVAKVLYDTCTLDNYEPGWKEFYRAEKLLSHVNWLEKASIMTIQTLLVKTSYCLYISRFNAAYDTMGTAVRLCFQLGLHNEPSWGQSCNTYDRTYRQRIFWSIYCLNLNVAQNCGVPDLMRESDFDVDRPKCVDDRMLYPNCPPVPEIHKVSPVPYMLQIIKSANLASEIWDAMFGVKAKRPVSLEFIETADRKAIELSRDTPNFLQWPPSSGSESPDSRPGWMINQSFILYLRLRALRMLLRREEMVGLRYGKRTAELCIEIATEMVNAIELSYSASTARRAERFGYALHLTGAIVPIICVIVRRDNTEELVLPAIHLLDRSLKIMEAISYGLSFARRTLHQLRRPIRVARDIIETKWSHYAEVLNLTSTFPNTQASMNGLTSFSQSNMWDPDGTILSGDGGEMVTEEMQRVPDDMLMWEDFDLWNNMNNWAP